MQLGHRCKLTAAGLRIHIGPVFQQKASGEDTNPDDRSNAFQPYPGKIWCSSWDFEKKNDDSPKKTPRFLQNREIILHKKRPKNSEVSMDRF